MVKNVETVGASLVGAQKLEGNHKGWQREGNHKGLPLRLVMLLGHLNRK